MGRKKKPNSNPLLNPLIIPMVRRVYPQLITSQIVGVQPMAGPVGMAFAMRSTYSTREVQPEEPKISTPRKPMVDNRSQEEKDVADIILG
jgi:hypothetical protein